MNKAGLRNVHSVAYKRFLKRLRQARLDAKLNQADVAKRLDKPQSYVSKSESGERRIDVVELADLAVIYKCPLEYFVADRQIRKSAKENRHPR